jgi:hypothetical protein
MFKKTITYTDFFGDKRTEDFYFNMNKSEVVEWQYSVNGGINRLFEKIVNDGDQSLLVNMIKDLIRRSYGERSIDGKRFEKKRNGQYLFDDFEQTMAYDALFMELIQDEKAAADFINGLMPPDLVAQMAAKNGGANAITAAR